MSNRALRLPETVAGAGVGVQAHSDAGCARARCGVQWPPSAAAFLCHDHVPFGHEHPSGNHPSLS